MRRPSSFGDFRLLLLSCLLVFAAACGDDASGDDASVPNPDATAPVDSGTGGTSDAGLAPDAGADPNADAGMPQDGGDTTDDGSVNPSDSGVNPGDGSVNPGDDGGVNLGDGSVNPGDGSVNPGDGSVDPGDGGVNSGDGGGPGADGGVNPGDGGVGLDGGGVDGGVPMPTIIGISPDPLRVDQGTVTATITGTGFTSGLLVFFNGFILPTRTVTSTQVVFDIPATFLLLPGAVEVRVELPQGGVATFTVAIVLQQTVVGPGVPVDLPEVFDNAPIGNDPAQNPAITYPEDQSFSPRDFPPPTVGWTQGATHNFCRLSVDGVGVDIDVFVATTGLPATENPNASVDSSLWSTILTLSQSLTLVMQVTCAEVTPGAGGSTLPQGTVFESLPITYDVDGLAAGGRIVYFSGLIQGLWRIEVGSFNAQGTAWIGPDPAFQFQTPGCVGCHSVSTSGTRMSYTSGISEFGILDTTGGNPSVLTPLSAMGGAEWTSIHPNGQFVAGVTNPQGELMLYDSAGALIGPVPTASVARNLRTQPFWSPTGDRLVFVASDQRAIGVFDPLVGELWTVDFDPATATFGTPVQLLAPTGTENYFYPAYSPDGQWIVFCSAPAGGAFNNGQARLQLIRADGVGGPIDLGIANQTLPNNFNSWPRWAPSHSQGIYWLVFSSQRPYPPLIGTGPQQLWVTRVDTNQFPQDPSSPAIWLSGQEPFTGNLTAEWSNSQ